MVRDVSGKKNTPPIRVDHPATERTLERNPSKRSDPLSPFGARTFHESVNVRGRRGQGRGYGLERLFAGTVERPSREEREAARAQTLGEAHARVEPDSPERAAATVVRGARTAARRHPDLGVVLPRGVVYERGWPEAPRQLRATEGRHAEEAEPVRSAAMGDPTSTPADTPKRMTAAELLAFIRDQQETAEEE